VLILNIVIIFATYRLVSKVSQPVSKYKDSLDAKIGRPVTILAAASLTFSSFLVSCTEQPSQKMEAYSSVGLINDVYNLERFGYPFHISIFSKCRFFCMCCLQYYQYTQTNRGYVTITSLDGDGLEHIQIYHP
jgi:hypothetical protein